MVYPGRSVRGGVATLAAVLVCAAATALSAPAGANPPGPHDTLGAVSTVRSTTAGLVVTGWATDPDSLTANHTVMAVLDGVHGIATTVTNVANATVQTKYKTGPTPGFSFTFAVPTGSHTVCIVAMNTGAGLSSVLKCVPLPLGTVLTTAQIATHSPAGAYQSATATATSLHVTGWSDDPDYLNRAAVVVLYVDGNPAATVVTTVWPTGVTPPTGAGARSKYDITVPVTTGAHVGCIWVVNIGLGSNRFLGCKTVDTRGPAGTGTVTTPAMNTKVVSIALQHKGAAYVWGAAGPTTFDCSGLVMFSYSKAGKALPRTSEQQFAAARLIPASRAVPGDLVFTYDSEGDVYHVGIYISPGKAFAAIDEAEGVNYQTIWDPKSTAYGSFTHI